MYIRNGVVFDINSQHIIGENQYPIGWFASAANRALFGISEIPDPVAPIVASNEKATLTGFDLIDGNYKPKWVVSEATAQEIADRNAVLADAKFQKNLEINLARATANQTYFTHNGKRVACDALSRSDIDAVANSISLNNAFPAGFPGAWKAIDNSYIMLPDVAAFKAMYNSMTAQGTINFATSQALKARLASASTLAEVSTITWGD